jgi:riboflavin kinase/FMN adenylyltransferase
MQRLTGFGNRSLYRGCLLSIGNFDGVHRGHQVIIAQLVELARQHAAPAVVLTFEPHPLSLINPACEPTRLTTPEERARLLGLLGTDVVLEYPTDWSLLNLTPRQFFDDIVRTELEARGLVEGPNFFFGKGRAGNVQTLAEFCAEVGSMLTVVAPRILGGQIISSSRIRDLLADGNVKLAGELLGRRYMVAGKVAVGAQRGRTLGFPTANLENIRTQLPAQGVYAAWCRVDGTLWPAAVSLGPNPTFAEGEWKVEAHLLGFSGDLYEHVAELEFVDRVRGLHQFGSADELKAQISQDLTATREILGGLTA